MSNVPRPCFFPPANAASISLPEQFFFFTLEDKKAIKIPIVWVLFPLCLICTSPILNSVGAISRINFLFLLCWRKPERWLNATPFTNLLVTAACHRRFRGDNASERGECDIRQSPGRGRLGLLTRLPGRRKVCGLCDFEADNLVSFAQSTHSHSQET